ncbi:MAG: carbonic anhydrase [Salinivirgaceae bacterium]|nr:carbonic anhydrase [Salinivirgaceae bacterium]
MKDKIFIIENGKLLYSLIVLLLMGILGYSQPSITDPDVALEKLKQGNMNYASEASTHPNLNQERRNLTSTKGQHPYATVIACSDSRVPVEQVFDAGIGDIFTIKVAGNVIDIDEAGSVEYGVDHLETPVFVVLGHTGCGACTAVARGDEVHGNIPALVDNIIPAAEKAKQQHGNDFSEDLLNATIKNNVWQAIEDLYKISHVSAELVKSGKLKVVGAIYNIETGKIEWLGEHPHQKELLNNTNH